MIVRGELNCLNCGYDLGDVEGPRGAPADQLVFLPTHQGDALIVDEQGKLKCPRCRGRILPYGLAPVNRPLNPHSLFEADMREAVALGLVP